MIVQSLGINKTCGSLCTEIWNIFFVPFFEEGVGLKDKVDGIKKAS